MVNSEWHENDDRVTFQVNRVHFLTRLSSSTGAHEMNCVTLWRKNLIHQPHWIFLSLSSSVRVEAHLLIFLLHTITLVDCFSCFFLFSFLLVRSHYKNDREVFFLRPLCWATLMDNHEPLHLMNCCVQTYQRESRVEMKVQLSSSSVWTMFVIAHNLHLSFSFHVRAKCARCETLLHELLGPVDEKHQMTM